MIKLNEDTIDKEDINKLCQWLKTNPQLTKNGLTKEFEKEFSNYLKCKYSIFVNSGSSANLLIIYLLKLIQSFEYTKKNNSIVVPALCWSTTISPVIQFGFDPIVCDINFKNLSIDVKQLEIIFKKENPLALFLVHPLGFPCEMNSIIKLCKDYKVILLEDSCETLGTVYNQKLCGTFGGLSSFSFFFGHTMSTIEGGMVCCNKVGEYNLIKMLRSHGWDRDLDKRYKNAIRKTWNVDDFNSLFTFYFPGFNVRSTDLNAFLGLEQLKKLNDFIRKRDYNLRTYNHYIKNKYWKVKYNWKNTISNFAYPILHYEKEKILKELKSNNIECRPIIAGNILHHPICYNISNKYPTENANKFDTFGFYLPNHPKLTTNDIIKISEIINSF